MDEPTIRKSRNVARRLAHYAETIPEVPAVVAQHKSRFSRRFHYQSIHFAELEADSSLLAAGLRAWGVAEGTRLALLVPPSTEFITLVFALLKAGAVMILIDPGMGRKHLLKCLEDAAPEGFVAVPKAQAVRTLFKSRFPKARWNVTVGKRLFWDGITLDELRERGRAAGGGSEFACSPKTEDDDAAVIFTTGSTGPPKGVLYAHGNFDRQVDEIRDGFQIQPGEVNLACFPLFGLFNAAMGVTTVIPDMDASRPARVNPANIVAAVNDWQATQSFASPAVWNRVGVYCEAKNVRMMTLREAYSAGAPVPPAVVQRMVGCMGAGGRLHTPYGATEALPVATITSPEILEETREAWAAGEGTCVGRHFPGIEWRVIPIVDGPIDDIAEAEPLSIGEIGELIVRGPVVTRRYVTRVEANAMAKIEDEDGFWHRMGDAGYLDGQDRFWFCGRVAQRVQTADGTLFTDPCEGIFNQHPALFRSALVGVGPVGAQRPVIVCELKRPITLPGGLPELERELLTLAAKHGVTKSIRTVLFHDALPVDIRHNSKIFREQLAVWAAKKLKVPGPAS
ncbi:MAG: peptide synthase [Pirellula sp.]|nr:peptide synthase [Pirellula sp.]